MWWSLWHESIYTQGAKEQHKQECLDPKQEGMNNYYKTIAPKEGKTSSLLCEQATAPEIPKILSSSSKILVKTFTPATKPPDPRRVSEGVSEGSLKGSLKGLWRGLWRVSEGVSKGPRTCQPKNPSKPDSKRLQEPFENLWRRCRNRCCVRLPGVLKSVPGSGVL